MKRKKSKVPQVGCLEIDRDMPAEFRDAPGDCHQLVFRREIDQRLTKLKRTPRTARLVQRVQSASLKSCFTVAMPRALPFECESASTSARLSAPWQVACTITLRAKPRMIAQGKELVLGRIARRVFALRYIGEFVRRAENMAMRIDSIGRQFESGLRGTGHTSPTSLWFSRIA